MPNWGVMTDQASLSRRDPTRRRIRLDWYATAWGLPMVLWQVLFFVIPLAFLVYLSFWLVRNYRMVPGFDVVNWVSMYGKDYFRDAYGLTSASDSPPRRP